MATESSTATEPGHDLVVEPKISRLRKLFADAPELGKKALENVLQVRRIYSASANVRRILNHQPRGEPASVDEVLALPKLPERTSDEPR
jgi:hypothetical protein